MSFLYLTPQGIGAYQAAGLAVSREVVGWTSLREKGNEIL